MHQHRTAGPGTRTTRSGRPRPAGAAPSVPCWSRRSVSAVIAGAAPGRSPTRSRPVRRRCRQRCRRARSTAPVFPLRSVPAYAVTTQRRRPGQAVLHGGTGQALPGADTGRLDPAVGRLEPRRRLHPGDLHRRSLGRLRRDDRPDAGARRASSTSAWPATSRSSGDWNRDGRTDVGVVRGNTWLLRNRPDRRRRPGAGSGSARPPTSRSSATGTATAGTASACAAAHHYFLRDSRPRAGKPTLRLHVRQGLRRRRSSATGTATAPTRVGVVRGSTWFLRAAASTLDEASSRNVTKVRSSTRPARPAGRGPCPWPTPAGTTAAACPTASAAVANRPQVGATVVPSAMLDKVAALRHGRPRRRRQPGLPAAGVAAGVRALPARRAVPRAVVRRRAASATPTSSPGSASRAGVRGPAAGHGRADDGRGGPDRGAQRRAASGAPATRRSATPTGWSARSPASTSPSPPAAGARAGRPRTGRSSPARPPG